tara:strand:+ start:17 stop:478 length:462 start_codon:yes stop_codon:yes gene_type:complete
MKYLFTILLAISVFTISCDRVKKKTKETINYGGETVGEAATEFIEGVSEGIDNTLECDLSFSDELSSKGVSKSVYSISDNLEYGGTNNALSVYLIFDKAYAGEITASVYNKTNLETGRVTINIDAESGSANYYEFNFHEKTHIDVKSIIKIGE